MSVDHTYQEEQRFPQTSEATAAEKTYLKGKQTLNIPKLLSKLSSAHQL